MSRIVRANQDLSGGTIDVSSLPEGHARQSYIGQCDLSGAIVLGDIRGSDILGCDLRGADLSQAEVYGCVWRGTTFDSNTIFPDDAGVLNDEITYERIRRFIPRMPARWRRRARDILSAHAVSDYQGFFQLANDVWQRDPDTARRIWEAMPERIQDWLRRMFTTTGCPNYPPAIDVTWPDGVSVRVDSNNLPALPRPLDRYELGRWIEARAGPAPSSLPGRWCWVARIQPWLGVFTLTGPDAWFDPGWGLF